MAKYLIYARRRDGTLVSSLTFEGDSDDQAVECAAQVPVVDGSVEVWRLVGAPPVPGSSGHLH